MSYTTSAYRGDELHTIDCTGDAVTGDRVCFDRATFTGSYRRPKFSGFERVTATIVADSYGAAKQQHTFTLELPDGSTTKIKGRNLYKNRVYRQPWADESARWAAADEKHARGDMARIDRALRRELEGENDGRC